MTAVELLQQIGLNKYEAEAYFTLLAEGPLTGYELGKRSPVPLSRSYEVLERLTQKGLALIQPGNPPRYLAAEPEQFLGQVRSTMTETLNALATMLAALPGSQTNDEFWVIRDQEPVLAQARALIAQAQLSIHLSLPAAYDDAVAAVLADASASGCAIARSTRFAGDPTSDLLLLLIDQQQALIGTLVANGRSQAVLSSNRALVAVLRSYFASPLVTSMTHASSVPRRSRTSEWVAWEDRKQRHLLDLIASNRSA